MDLTIYRRNVNRLIARRRVAVEKVEQEGVQLKAIGVRLKDTTEAREIVQSMAQTIQSRVHRRIAGVVTRCLNAVFDDPYEFSIRFESKRGRTEPRFIFSRDGREFDDPLNEIGGGVIDVAALALRVACILMTRPKLRRLLVLDEPLKNVRGAENRMRVRRMLLGLSEELEIQFVLNVDVDAYPEFGLGKVVEL